MARVWSANSMSRCLPIRSVCTAAGAPTVRGSGAATGRARASSGSELKTVALASAIKTWFGDNKVSPYGGTFGFSLTAFSALELNTQPLVQIPALTLDIRYISDLT
jgi:hypothetical protein